MGIGLSILLPAKAFIRKNWYTEQMEWLSSMASKFCFAVLYLFYLPALIGALININTFGACRNMEKEGFCVFSKTSAHLFFLFAALVPVLVHRAQSSKIEEARDNAEGNEE